MFKDKYAKKAHEITQDYIESFGAQFTNIDDLDDAIASALREVAGHGVQAERQYTCVEEYIDWMKDEQPALDKPVVVDLGGTRIRFKNDEEFANWLSEMLSK